MERALALGLGRERKREGLNEELIVKVGDEESLDRGLNSVVGR